MSVDGGTDEISLKICHERLQLKKKMAWVQ